MKNVIVIFVLFCCSRVIAQNYPVNIVYNKGVKEIHNPKIPKDGKYELVIKDLFCLGKEETNSQYILSMPYDIAFDKDNNIVLVQREMEFRNN